jgi:hypothetical protein
MSIALVLINFFWMDEQFLKAFFCFFVKLYLPIFSRPGRPIEGRSRPDPAHTSREKETPHGANRGRTMSDPCLQGV